MILRQMISVGILIVLLVACSPAQPEMTMDLPADVDVSTTKPSDNGAFVAELTPDDPNPVINELTQWNLQIQTPEGDPVEGAQVSIGGGMPEHDHGFPTEPIVTEAGAGTYTVEGVRFHMAGWWEISFNIQTDDAADTITFNVVLP